MHRFIYSNKKNFVEYISGWQNKSTIRPPPTVVIRPESPNSGFTLDVRYVDYTAVFDVYDHGSSTHPPCYIVPPYKPLMYLASVSTTPITVTLFNGNTPQAL